MKKSNEKHEELFFRQEKLRTLLEDGESRIMGHMTPVNGYMEEDGAFSLKRTEKLVERLLDSLSVYLNFERRIKMIDLEGGEESIEYYAIPDEEKTAYKGFLYCSLISLYVERACNDNPGPVRFSALIKKAQEVRIYESYQELLRQKYLDPKEYTSIGIGWLDPQFALGRKPDLFRELCYFYDKSVEFLKEHKTPDLSGKIPPKAQYPYCAKRKEWQAMLDSVSEKAKKRRQREIDEEMEWLKDGQMSEEEAAAYLAEDVCSPEELQRRKEYEKKEKEAAERRKELLGRIDLKIYREYLRGCLLHQDFLFDQKNHVDAVTGMINVFLMDEKASVISDIDRFYEVFVRLENAINYDRKTGAARETAPRGRG